MKTEHTPGPWHAMPFGRDAESRLGGNTIYGEDNCRVAEVLYSRIQASKRRTQEEHKANARLIAAAPELLEALNDCVNYLDTLPQRDETVWQMAMAAIAKATGGAQ